MSKKLGRVAIGGTSVESAHIAIFDYTNFGHLAQ